MISALQRLLALLVFGGCAAFPGFAARAMDITTMVGADSRRIVLARGAISAGDTERLRAALVLADRDPEGLRTVALDSPGGAVEEAFAMAVLMDRERVAVVVPAGATCASACAQIVFLAGVYRIVKEGGRLGLHSCSRAGSGARETMCNDMIAQQAAARGAPYATIMAFIQLAGPAQMKWLDAADADCWGLTLWPPGNDRGIKRGDVPLCILRGPAPRPVVKVSASTQR